MDQATLNLAIATPELVLLGGACIALIADVYFGERSRLIAFHVGWTTLVTTAVLCIWMYAAYPDAEVIALNGTFISDPMSILLKIFVLLVSYFVFFYSRVYLDTQGLFRGEFFVLILFAVLGMMVLVSANNLLLVYLGLELLSLSLYALVAFKRDSQLAAEAAMKYFVLGALASGMLLYGMALLYGVTGTLVLPELRAGVAAAEGFSAVLAFALVFIVVGIAFKLGAVPFHMWVPDVYEGAPTAVALFIASAPKIAAFGMLMRLLVDGLPELYMDWSAMLSILAVISLGLGNVVAIAQTNLKRMLAYSTIAHVGFLLLGVISGTAAGYAASMFYVITYAIMSSAAFGMIVVLSKAGAEADRLDDFKGLNQRSPWLAFMMLIVMLAMAGLPPFLGFWAKWSVLREIVAAGQVWLAVVAILFSVVGLFYYLRVVRLMYFEDSPEALPGMPSETSSGHSLGMSIEVSPQSRFVVSANALAILGLGIYPAALLAMCATAMN